MLEQDRNEDQKSMETNIQKSPVVFHCIDFRTGEPTRRLLKKQGLVDGSYHLYASAGASANPSGFIETITKHQPSSITAVDHQDCGYYKKAGDDSIEKHKHNLEVLGNSLREKNPQISYDYHFLTVNDNRHTCSATAIILGAPKIVKLARQKLKELGLKNDHDEIARPRSLSIDDESLWNDLEISLALHQPSRILLFEEDEANAQKLVARIKQIAQNAHVEPILVQAAA